MNQWAKLHAKLAESEDFMALHCADPNAALLFLMALPQAAPWGILPATPALFRARVCPMLDLSLEQVQTCLRLIVDQGCFTAYEDRHGKPLVYITNWSENQSRQWDRVAAPQYDLPPNWTPPAGLAKGLADAAKRGRNLRLSAIEERLQDDTSRENLGQVLDSTLENVPESKTCLRPVLDQSQTSLTQRVERGEERKGKSKGNAHAPEGACASPEPEPPLQLSSEDLPAPAEPEPGPTPTAEPAPPAKPRELTPQQQSLQDLWTAVDLPGKPGPQKGEKPSYAAAAALVAQHGTPMVAEFAVHCRSSGVSLPEGASPWPWFVSLLRDAMKRPWEWREKVRDKSPQPTTSPRSDFKTGVGTL